MEFQKVIEKQIETMRATGLIYATIKAPSGDKATIKCDKHGFFHVSVTEQKQITV